jgi:hypothetical protein
MTARALAGKLGKCEAALAAQRPSPPPDALDLPPPPAWLVRVLEEVFARHPELEEKDEQTRLIWALRLIPAEERVYARMLEHLDPVTGRWRAEGDVSGDEASAGSPQAVPSRRESAEEPPVDDPALPAAVASVVKTLPPPAAAPRPAAVVPTPPPPPAPPESPPRPRYRPWLLDGVWPERTWTSR